MSMVSVQSDTRRTSGPSAPAHSAPDVQLAALRPGMRGRVVAIDESVEPSTARRLFDLGFAPGAEVTMLRKAPLGDPAVFRIAEYEVALRKTQTARIRVQPTA